MARFDNKVVLVSGGARGQGAAEARLLVAQGAKVVIGDVLDNQGQALAVELGPAAVFVRHDVTRQPIGPAPLRPPRSSAAYTAWSTTPGSTSRPR
jgi:NAD(P)-dependent dehydrogenase (short-subunit alcohol dehydrogenase family)